MTANWEERPTSLEVIDMNDLDYILAVDESGTTHNYNEQNKWLTLGGVAIDLIHFENITKGLMDLKNKYWENGMFYGKRVIFHSRDILRRQKAFCYSGLSDYDNFKLDLSQFVSELPLDVISSSIDKEKLIQTYFKPYPTYNLAVEFMIERYIMLLESKAKTGIIVFESRGRKEDQDLLSFVNNLLNNGNKYINNIRFKNRILGVFFNKKHTDDFSKSYWVLEIADICSNSIYNYLKDNDANTFPVLNIFPAIEKKFLGYPKYHGKGMKIFPK